MSDIKGLSLSPSDSEQPSWIDVTLQIENLRNEVTKRLKCLIGVTQHNHSWYSPGDNRQ